MESKKIKFRYILINIVMLMIVGITGLYVGKRIAYRDVEILYISQSEILDLEKERVENIKDNQLFFGDPKKAIELIEGIQTRYEKPNRKIFLSQGKIYNSNVRSISKQVHEEIISKLAENYNKFKK